MKIDIRRDCRMASAALAILSAIATAWCYLTGYSGITAILFAALGVICCLMQPRLWAIVVHARQSLSVAAFAIILGAAVLCSWVDFTSNFQTIAAARGLDVQQGRVQTTAYENTHETIAANRTLLKTKQQQLSALTSEHPWIATTSAASITAQIANAEGDYIFKRSRGCSDVTLPESRRFCDGRAALQTRLGLVERHAALTEEIGNLQRRIDGKVEVAKTETPGASYAWLQSEAITGFLSWDGTKPSQVASENLFKIFNLVLALALWLLPSALAVYGYADAIKPQEEEAPGAPPPSSQQARVRYQTSTTHQGPPGGGIRTSQDTDEVQPLDVTVPVRIKHDIRHEPSAAQVVEIRNRTVNQSPARSTQRQRQQARSIVRVRDTAFARRVAALTDQYKMTASA